MAMIKGLLLPSSICEQYYAKEAFSHNVLLRSRCVREYRWLEAEIPGGPHFPHADLWTQNARQPRSRFVLHTTVRPPLCGTLSLPSFAPADFLHGRAAHALISREPKTPESQIFPQRSCAVVSCWHAGMNTCYPHTGEQLITAPSIFLQLATINFFMTFLATFAPAALLPTIRENLSLTSTQTGLGGGQPYCLSPAGWRKHAVLLASQKVFLSSRPALPHPTNAGVTAVVGAVFGRMFMGGVLDTLGERWLCHLHSLRWGGGLFHVGSWQCPCQPP